MAVNLYESLSANSTPEQIAAAYSQYTAGAGGDTAANQQAAMQYLGNLGISDKTIGSAYNVYQTPTPQPAPMPTPRVSEATIQDWFKATPNATLEQATKAGSAAGMMSGDITNAYNTYGTSATPAVSDATIQDWFKATPNATLEQATTAGRNAGMLGGDITNAYNTYGQKAPPPSYEDTVAALTKEILAQGTTSGWSGEGLGSAEANAEDMAKIMADAGMTSLSQFGKVTQKAQVQVTPQYKSVLTGYDSDNDPQYRQEIVGYVDAQGNPVDAAGVAERADRISNEDFETNYYARTGADEDAGYGNTATNTMFANTYSERQKDNAWGGTFAGKGNTGYRVDMDAQGNPVFYTTEASSNDLANMLQKSPILNTVATTIAASFGPVGSAALQLLQGNSVGDAAKAALLTYAAQGIFKGAPVTTDASQLAADVAGLASQGLSAEQIASTVGEFGYSSAAAAELAANMAVGGATVADITTAMTALSKTTGLTSQNISSAELVSADTLQLKEQVGNNAAAIEQNLNASGVDPLVSADLANQVILHPEWTQQQLQDYASKTFGEDIYDVDVDKLYPTNQLPGPGGFIDDTTDYLGDADTLAVDDGTLALDDVLADTTDYLGDADTLAVNDGTIALDSKTLDTVVNELKKVLPGVDLKDLAKLALLLKGGKSLGGDSPSATPITPYQPQSTMPQYTDDYYQQLQNYYTGYMPDTPRDVVTPLKSWYNKP